MISPQSSAGRTSAPPADQRPQTLPVQFAAIPDELKQVHRWLLWRYKKASDGRWSKSAHRPGGRPARSADSSTWSTFNAVKNAFEAARAAGDRPSGAEPYDGIGFFLGGGFSGLALDAVLSDAETALPWSAALVADFAGYTERSPGGDGLRILFRGTFSGSGIGPVSQEGGGSIEAYSCDRFFCITGVRWPSAKYHRLATCDARLTHLLDRLRREQRTASLRVNIAPIENAAPLVPFAPHASQTPHTPEPAVNGTRPPVIDLHEAAPNPSHPVRAALPSTVDAPPNSPPGIAEFQKAEAAVRAAARQCRELESEIGALLNPDLAPRNPRWLASNSKRPVAGSPPRIPSTHHPLIDPQEAASPNSVVSAFPSPAASHLPVSRREKLRPAADLITADLIVDLALSDFRMGRTRAGEAFAVELTGPNVARMFRGGPDALRAMLARRARLTFGRTPTSTSLGAALNVIHAEAAEATPEDVPLRVSNLTSCQPLNDLPPALAPFDSSTVAPSFLPPNHSVVIDLGRPDGRAVIVSADGWTVVDRSPILFRRTALTGELPIPERGGRLDQLRSLVNVTDEGWILLRGWLVAALFPAVAHPVLLLGGLQGAGKSTALRILCGLVDPSPAPLRSEPRESEHWAVMAAGSWCIPLDNVSSIPPWLSDALCKAVTGDGLVRRRIHTDGELSVLEFRRVIAMSSIDPGALRGDLADRLLLVELERIDDRDRQSESLLLETFEQQKPRFFGALLDEVSAALRHLPQVRLRRLPRMADFARILQSLDIASGKVSAEVAAALPGVPSDSSVPSLPSSPSFDFPSLPPISSSLSDGRPQMSDGTSDGSDSKSLAKKALSDGTDGSDGSALAIYFRQARRLAAEVIEGDALGLVIAEWVQARGEWEGTAAELLAAISDQELGSDLPKTPRALSGRLRRLAPALGSIGITVDYERDSGRFRKRSIRLSSTNGAP